jgi:hypothetical protein
MTKYLMRIINILEAQILTDLKICKKYEKSAGQSFCERKSHNPDGSCTTQDSTSYFSACVQLSTIELKK